MNFSPAQENTKQQTTHRVLFFFHCKNSNLLQHKEMHETLICLIPYASTEKNRTDMHKSKQWGCEDASDT